MGPRDHMQKRAYLTRSLCCPWGERKTLRVWVRPLSMGPRVCIPERTISCQLACRDILPTKRNLLRRNILQDSRCEGCNQEDETAGHLFWTCPRAREMWQNSKWVFLVQSEHCSSFKELMWCLLMVNQPRFELAAKVGMCAWALWHNRNEVRLAGVRKAGYVLLQWAVQYLEEYYAVYELSPTPSIPATHRKTWSPPLDHYYKVNVDGATFSDLGAVGFGVIVRDVSGQVVAALSSKLMAPLGAIEMEAKALEAGL
ncbi:hypothetical protein ACB092_05G034700 [Castanea dentata]